MPVDSRNIVEVFGSFMADIRAAIDPINGLVPYYEYGHPYDIASKLNEKSNSTVYSDQMFPMICLLLDVPMEKGYNIAIEYKVSPTVLILAVTDPNYHSEDRLTNVFTPILHPIYDKLMSVMSNSKYIKYRNEGILHTHTDRYYWGKLGIKLSANESPVFNQKLDGIEINFRDLEIYKSKNCNKI